MFSQDLAGQLHGTGVVVHCLDPGFNVTGLGRELSFSAQLARGFQLVAHRRSAAWRGYHRTVGDRFTPFAGIGWVLLGEGRKANTSDAASR
jgi:hypothetical protein